MLVSHLFLDSFRRSGSQNRTQLLWGGSRSCCWRRLRCLVTQITEFESSWESGLSMRYGKQQELLQSVCQRAVTQLITGIFRPCCCIPRGHRWCGRQRKMCWRRGSPTARQRKLSVFSPEHVFDQYRPSNVPRRLFFLLLLQRLLAKLTNKEKELSKLAEHLDFEKVWTSRLVLPKWKDNTAGIFVPSLSHSNMHLF